MSGVVQLNGADEIGGLTRRPRLGVALVGGSQAQRGSIKDVLGQVHEVEADIIELGNHAAPEIGDEVGLIAVLLDPADRQKWAAVLRPSPPGEKAPMVVALLADHSSELIRAALRAGAEDVLGIPPTADEALRLLLRARESRREGEKGNEKQVCSLVGVACGRGVDHLTVNLGLAAQRLLEKSVSLVDLDLQAAPLSVLLDIEPEHTISELADPTSPIDSIRLESVLSKHASGLCLLAAPKLIEETELVSAATVEAVLKVLQNLFEVVMVDCGSYLNESSVVVFEHSSALLYVLDQSVTAIRAAQRFLKLFERLSPRDLQPKLIVNRYRRDVPITLERIEAALRMPVFATVPRDDAAFMEMETSGRTLWKISSGSRVRDSLEALVRKLFPVDQSSGDAARPGLFSRILARLGR